MVVETLEHKQIRIIQNNTDICNMKLDECKHKSQSSHVSNGKGHHDFVNLCKESSSESISLKPVQDCKDISKISELKKYCF